MRKLSRLINRAYVLYLTRHFCFRRPLTVNSISSSYLRRNFNYRTSVSLSNAHSLYAQSKLFCLKIKLRLLPRTSKTNLKVKFTLKLKSIPHFPSHVRIYADNPPTNKSQLLLLGDEQQSKMIPYLPSCCG